MRQRNDKRMTAGRRKSGRHVASCVLAVLAAMWSTQSPEVRAADEEKVDVLVRLTSGADRTTLRAWATERLGSVRYEYRILPDTIALRSIPKHQIDELEQLPGVESVQTDRRISVNLIDSVPRIQGLAGQVTDAELFSTGAGVRVCICDTGINLNHIMYSDRIDAAAGFDFVNDDADPSDDNGHGSHVAGIVAGRTGIEVDFLGGAGPEPLQGVAPEATLIAVKIINANGNGNLSDAIAGIDHCASQIGRAHV